MHLVPHSYYLLKSAVNSKQNDDNLSNTSFEYLKAIFVDFYMHEGTDGFLTVHILAHWLVSNA